MTPAQGKAAYDQQRAGTAKAGSLVDVAGVGDAAFGFSRGTVSNVTFRKGDASVVIVVLINASSSPPKDQAIALARAASGRM